MRTREWQRFFSGLVIGAVLGWLFFLLLFGMMHDQQVEMIETQQREIQNLKETIELYQKDIDELNKRSENKLLIRQVKVKLINAEKLKLLEREKFELEKEAKKEMEELLLNKDIETVTENKELLISSLENKQFTIEEKKYRLKVKELYLTTTVELYLEAALE